MGRHVQPMDDAAFWAAARERAAALDAADPLAPLRGHFHLPEDLVYLDGNSLGAAPLAALRALREAAEREWAEGLITSWNEEGWFALPATLGARLAPLIGAEPSEVIVCDTVTLNLYKLLHAALALRPGRHEIIAVETGFHTDRYIAQGVAEAAGVRLVLAGSADEAAARARDETAVVILDHVDYRTGALHDMAALTAEVQRAGALVVWDLCHSVGVMQVALGNAGADFAVGCTYKYLGAGPGAPAFLYCATRHLAAARQPVTGWWGHVAPFAFERDFRPDPSMRRFLTGTPPVLAMRPLAAALDLFAEIDMGRVRAKSVALTELFIELVESACHGQGLELASPRDPARRGSQVAFRHDHAWPVMQALIAAGVVGDFRAPDILRFGFAPLYLRFADVVRAAETLADILAEGRWQDPRFAAPRAVT